MSVRINEFGVEVILIFWYNQEIILSYKKKKN